MNHSDLAWKQHVMSQDLSMKAKFLMLVFGTEDESSRRLWVRMFVYQRLIDGGVATREQLSHEGGFYWCLPIETGDRANP